MATVTQSLAGAIESWSELKPTDFSLDDALSDLWGRTGSPFPFEDVGIELLIKSIRRRKLFKNCEQASEDNMRVGMFRAGGGLKSFRTLFEHLENCS